MLKKQVSWKESCCNGYVIFLILFTKSMRKPNTWLVQLSYLLSCGWLWIGMCRGQVLIFEYFCANWIPVILLKYLDRGLICIVMLYSHNQLYKHIIHRHLHMHAHMYAEHNDTIKTSDIVLRKIYLSLYWKGCVWEGVGDRTELHILTPTLMAISVSFPFSWAAQPGAWGPSLSGSWFSLPHLISDSSYPQLLSWGPEGSLCWVLAFSTASSLQLVWSPNWLPAFTELYNSSTSTFLWASQIALIQPIHGQGYNILIDRMHLLFIKVHFLFWQPDRVVGQYTSSSLNYVLLE